MLTMSFILVVLLGHLLQNFVVNGVTTYTVNIGTQGTIVGYEYDSTKGLGFLGIPYAQPMTIQNRFTSPVRKDPVGQTRAFHFGSTCMQASNPGHHNEDCLYLNVFTPLVPNLANHSYPVFIWIHGGGYIDGSGNLSPESVFKSFGSRDIIVVSINYRLGVFGFFTTRDSTIPGNMGIQDQIEAIKWVRRWIPYFGGDINTITIGGHSAGAMSTSLLTLSPISQHLFKQALLESGSGFSTGYFSNYDLPNDASKSVAVNLGCINAQQWDQHSPALMAQMLRCMRSKTADEIQYAKINGRCLPVVDGPGGTIPERLEMLAQKRPGIPIMTGNAHDEKIFTLLNSGLIGPNSTEFINRFTHQSAVNEWSRSYFLEFYNNSQLVEKAIQNAYLDNSGLQDNDHIGWVKVWIQLYTELQFIGPTYRDAMLFRQTNSPVYLYSFDYLAPKAFPTLNAQLRGSGIPHGWEVPYVFGYPGKEYGGWDITADDVSTENYMDQFWTNFIKFGNPTPAPSPIVWPRLGTRGEFMSLGPHPTPSVGFHPIANIFACTVPAIEGYIQAWCT